MTKQDFFQKALLAAKAAGHIFPEYAVCEAALESAWGGSKCAVLGNNLFGQKVGSTTKEWPVIELPTNENVDLNHDGIVSPEEVIRVNKARWAKFPDWETCFRERMEVLQKVSLYQNALNAKTGEEFIRLVSIHWATDPYRADKVLLTYRFNKERIKAIQ